MNLPFTATARRLRRAAVVLALGTSLLTATAQGADSILVLTSSPAVEDTAMQKPRNVGDLIRIGSPGILRENETCNDAVIMGSTAAIRGRVLGDLVIIGGIAEVYNRVDGDLVVVGGSANLSPGVRIGGELVNVGGNVQTPENLHVGGQRVEIAPFTGSMFSSARTYARLCLLKGRLISEHLPWTIAVLGALILLGFLLSMLFAGTFASAVRVASEKPGLALLTGVLAALASGPVVIALLATVIGIPAVPVFIIMLGGLVFIGVTGVYAAIGRQVMRMFTTRPGNALIAALIGAVITVGLAMIPWIGAIVIFIVFTFGAGAGVWGFFERIREGRKPAPPSGNAGPVAPLPPTDGTTVTPAPEPAHQPVSAVIAAPLPGNTMQATELEAPAGMWPRLGAACIDILLVFLVYGMTIGALIGHGGQPFPMHNAQGGLHVLCLIVYLAAMWVWKGTTVGNIVFHLQVRRTDNSRITIGVAVVRALGLILSVAPLGLGFFWINWDPDRQAWHDKIAGTKVVRVPKGVPLV